MLNRNLPGMFVQIIMVEDAKQHDVAGPVGVAGCMMFLGIQGDAVAPVDTGVIFFPHGGLQAKAFQVFQ